MRLTCFCLLLALSLESHALPACNPELEVLFTQDQGARKAASSGTDWAALSRDDAARRIRVTDIMRDGGVQCAIDYHRAAMIFQHGSTADEAKLASSLASIAAFLDPGNEDAKWLAAAAWDRYMMRRNQPQWFGTQYIKGPSGQWELYQVAEGLVTDEERRANGVPALETARNRVKTRTQQQPKPETSHPPATDVPTRSRTN